MCLDTSLEWGLSMNFVPPSSTKLLRTLTLNVTRRLEGNHHHRVTGHLVIIIITNHHLISMRIESLCDTNDRKNERKLTILFCRSCPSSWRHLYLTPSSSVFRLRVRGWLETDLQLLWSPQFCVANTKLAPPPALRANVAAQNVEGLRKKSQQYCPCITDTPGDLLWFWNSR